MTTADYALIVSICSAVVSLLGFGWNVWSKFIYPKAKVKVTYYTCVVTMGAGPPWPSFINLSATNFGPTDITLQSVSIVISRGRFKQVQHALVNPIENLLQPELPAGPFAGGLPKKLAVGESHSAYFPHNAQSFSRENLVRVAFNDNFGRTHGASKRQIRKVKVELDRVFAAEPYVSTVPPKRAKARS